ncbi:MAG TPA: hypothetical protein VF516_38990 [Kofleriaceae bacterium]
MARAKANTRWTVLPHTPIERLSERLWRIEGALPNMPLRRVMAIARRSDGGLVVHNAIAVDDAALAAIEAWGPVAAIFVPSGYHRLDAVVFHDRYPAARVICPRGARAKVEQVVPVTGNYEDEPADPAVALETLDGTAANEGVMIVRDGDGATLVFNDIVFNMPHLRGVSGFVLRWITASSGGPRVSRIARWFIAKDKPALRGHLERLAATPQLRRIVVSHHEVIDRDPARVLREVAATL